MGNVRVIFSPDVSGSLKYGSSHIRTFYCVWDPIELPCHPDSRYECRSSDRRQSPRLFAQTRSVCDLSVC